MEPAVLRVPEDRAVEDEESVRRAARPREGDALHGERSVVVRVLLEDGVETPGRILVLPEGEEAAGLPDEEVRVRTVQEEPVLEASHRVVRAAEVDENRTLAGEGEPVAGIQGEGVVERREGLREPALAGEKGALRVPRPPVHRVRVQGAVKRLEPPLRVGELFEGHPLLSKGLRVARVHLEEPVAHVDDPARIPQGPEDARLEPQVLDVLRGEPDRLVHGAEGLLVPADEAGEAGALDPRFGIGCRERRELDGGDLCAHPVDREHDAAPGSRRGSSP